MANPTPVVKSNWPHPRLEGWIAKDRYHSLPFRIVGLWLDRLILLTLDCSEGLLTAEPRKPPTSWTAHRESPTPTISIGYRLTGYLLLHSSAPSLLAHAFSLLTPTLLNELPYIKL